MLDVLIDGVLDTLKVLPYLFIAFLILEFIEHKFSEKSKKALVRNRKLGPVIGGLLGALPQCGFSAMASNLFSKRVITIGTIIAIYLSTSDEMLAIMISENVNIKEILIIILLKVFIGILFGLIIDIIFYKKNRISTKDIHEMCEEEDCHCEEEGLFLSSLKHTLHISLFILIANLVINILIYFISEETISGFLANSGVLSYFVSSLIGLIPNCASSVIITKLYLSGLISLGCLLSGLLTGSGIGLLILFKTNKNLKENFTVLGLIYIIGVICGFIIDLI